MTIAGLCPSVVGMTDFLLPSALRTLLPSAIAALLSVGSSACFEAGEDCQDVTLLGGCADNSGGYTQPSPPRSLGALLGDGARCPGQNYRCSIAVSGTDKITVGANGASDLEVDTSPGFALTAIPTPPVQPLAFSLRAPDVESGGSLLLSSANMTTVSEELQAHAVYDVSVVAAWGPNRYSRENAIVPTSSSRFVVALWSNEDSGLNPPYEPSRLIDTSLRSLSPFVEQLDWDTFSISAAPGVHSLEFTSDSTGSIFLEVEVTND